MTIGTSRGTHLTVDTLVLRAYQRAGILPVGTDPAEVGVQDHLAYGRFELHLIVQELGGYEPARLIQPYDITLVAGTQSYDLPDTVQHTVGDGQYKGPNDTVSTHVRQINGESWQSLSDKASQGRPVMFFCDRGGDDYAATIRVYQIPDSAGTLTVRAQYKPADTLVGSTTIDLSPAAMNYVVSQLTALVIMANNGNQQRANILFQLADKALSEVRRFEAEQAAPAVELRFTPMQRRC